MCHGLTLEIERGYIMWLYYSNYFVHAACNVHHFNVSVTSLFNDRREAILLCSCRLYCRDAQIKIRLWRCNSKTRSLHMYQVIFRDCDKNTCISQNIGSFTTYATISVIITQLL